MSMEHKLSELPGTALDSAVLEELRSTFGDNSEVVSKLYANFLAHATGYLKSLRDQTGEDRTTTLHTLKGSAAMMGAVRLAALAANLHEASARNPEQLSEAAIRQLEDELAMFRHALALRFVE